MTRRKVMRRKVMRRKTKHVSVLLAALAAASLVGQHPALANERILSRSAKALDALCVSTRFDPINLDVQVQLFQHRALPRDAVRKMSRSNEMGYAVMVDHSPVTVTFGRRQLEDEVSRNCTVTIKDLAFAEAADLLQSHYAAEELDRFSHGLSEMAVYRAALPSYAADMFFSVQSGGGLTALSFFEAPTAQHR